MLQRLFNSHPEIKALRTFATPGILKVFEPYTLALETKSLLKKLRDPEAFELALRNANERGPLKALRSCTEGTPILECDPSWRDRAGHGLLTTYFNMFRHEGPAIVDLRLRLRVVGDELIWIPRPLMQQWLGSFRGAMWDIYAGYYEESPERLDSGLRQLSLLPVKDAFLEHFGKDPSALCFNREEFYASFESIFVRCKEAGIPMHPSLIGVGFSLATLYQSLEELGGTYDVRKCFESARGVN